MKKDLEVEEVFTWLCANVKGFAEAGIQTTEDLEDTLEGRSSETVSSVVAPPPRSVKVLRGGHTVKVPKPTLVTDSRERYGYRFERFSRWIEGSIVKTLKDGDYSVEGMESEIAIERKSFADAVCSVMPPARERFLRSCARMRKLSRKAIVIEASLSDLKSAPYTVADTQAHPNAVVGSYLALQERWGIPVVFAGTWYLAEEWVANVLTKFHTLRWLEDNGYSREFVEGDI